VFSWRATGTAATWIDTGTAAPRNSLRQ